MKKLILIFGTFAIICVAISATFDNINPNSVSDTQIQLSENDAISDSYTIKSENGRVVVYKGDELLIKTSTSTSTLPKKDEKELLYGITVKTRQEVDRLLEQYCS
ncbi:MAG: hypothetical protein IJ015_03680 [Ruminococcus sp.]|nr:hypothetical protein [Ruminococcus sp.]